MHIAFRIPRAEVTRLFESIKRTGEYRIVANQGLRHLHHSPQLSNLTDAARRKMTSYVWKPWDLIDAGRRHREILISSSRAMSAQGIVVPVSPFVTNYLGSI